jgi:LPLT family lysophospholipid transporter-like MFS transporter
MGADTSSNQISPVSRVEGATRPAGVEHLWSPALIATLGSQFLSALADNALIFAALAVVHRQSYPEWAGPLLQEFFIVTYVLLAPFVGAFADMQPKGRAMFWANAIKLAGAVAMCLRVNPFLSYAVVGAGAAAYSPAKYGILTDLVAPTLLVKVNGLLETATIVAILLGAVTGGALTDWSVAGALIIVAGCYAAAMLGTLLIPKLKPAKLHADFAFTASIKAFSAQTASFLREPDLRAALIGTGVFWGAGAALRFLLIAWVPSELKIQGTSMPGYLTGMVAAGIALGAVLAGRFVKIESAHRAIPAGILLGVGVGFLPLIKTLPEAFALMAFVGSCSGFLVVPLDALLQQHGNQRGGVGSAIAIQNLFENLCMLALMSAYTAAMYAAMPINMIALCIGIIIFVSMSALLIVHNLRPPKRRHFN